jgi:nitrogen-specific signal transduction histidine kinase
MNSDLSPPDGSDSSRRHQLKNRLTVVKGVAQLLDRQVRQDDWQREKIVQRVERLQDEIARLEVLIADYGTDDDAVSDDDLEGTVH